MRDRAIILYEGRIAADGALQDVLRNEALLQNGLSCPALRKNPRRPSDFS